MQRKLRQFAWILLLSVAATPVATPRLLAEGPDGHHSMRHRDRDRDRDRGRDREREDRTRDRERDRDRNRDRDRDRDRDQPVTASAPTGAVNRGFSTGHPTVDWTNRFRRHFRRVTPFAIAGVSNSVPDTGLVTRTFTSLGNVVHFEEGVEYDLTSRLYTGASAYHVLPFGNQEVFNRLSGDSDGNNAGPERESHSHDQPTAAGSNLTRENGFETWLGFEPTRLLRMEAGYSRSLTFALNRLSFNVGVNVGRMMHSLKPHRN